MLHLLANNVLFINSVKIPLESITNILNANKYYNKQIIECSAFKALEV